MKNRVPLLLIAFLFNGLTVSAQSWLWGKQTTTTGLKIDLTSSNVATNRTGNVYQSGGFETSITFGTTTLISLGLNDGFLVKYDQNGNLLWARQSKSAVKSSATVYSVATDDSDNSYVTGFAWDTVAFGADTLYLPPGDMFLVKYDPNGNVVWAKSGTNFIYNVEGWAVTVDNFGHEYVTGDGVFLIKYDQNGNIIWTLPQAKNNSQFPTFGNSITTDISGNVYVSGQFQDSITFGNYHLYASYIGIFIAKFDSNGKVLWAQQSSNREYTDGFGTSAVDRSGAVYLTWPFSQTITFGSYTFTSTNSTNNFLLIKYNTDGTIAWGKEAIPLNGSGWESYSVCTDDSSHIYISGGEGGTGSAEFSFANDTINDSYNSNHTSSSFLLKLDSSGNVICSSSVDGGGDVANAVTANSSGKFVYLGGVFYNSFSLGSDSLEDKTGGGFTYVGRWVSCYQCNSVVINTSQSSFICSGQSVSLVAGGGTNYTWSPATGLSSMTGDSVEANPTITTTYNVITKGGSCGIDSSQIVVFIIPSPNKPTLTQHGDTLISSAKYDNLWYRNDTLLTNDTSRYLIINIAGEYLVNVLNEANGCSTSSDSAYETPSGFNIVSVYPNPTNNQIIVSINSSSTDLSGWNLKLIDILGRTIYSMSSLNHTNIINLETLPAAMYFVTVTNNTGRTVVPVVKVN